MNWREEATIWDGAKLALAGKVLRIGEVAPSFKAVKENLQEITLEDFGDKIKIISVIPSVDTPVCDAQTRRFNVEASKLGDDVVILTVSMDLPFAQSRFCAAAGLEQVVMLSDYRYADFGKKYGFLIRELHLLSRGMVVLDRQNVIRYIEYVLDADNSVNFIATLEAVKKLV